jgi:protoporphyrinogen oxidase
VKNIVILGSGMGGFGAAWRFHAEGVLPTMYDKNAYHGGHTASFKDSGYIFDQGPHISFTKDTRIQDLFADSVGQLYETMQLNANNYWRGYWPQHPVQQHMHGLPEDVIVKAISDLVEERQGPERVIRNYGDWLLASFGKTFAEFFPMQYTRKYHLTTAENMSTDWLGPRISRPNLDEVLRGAISPSAPTVHYISNFRYPREGGFMSYLKKFLPLGNLKLNHELVAIDPRARQLRFSNGVVAGYDALVSSVPLPELIRMMQGVPQDVRNAAERLACSTCVLVNVGVNRTDLSKSQLTYIYDDDVCFTRLSFPHMFSENNTPKGTGSIQAEVYFSDKYKPMTGTPEDWIEPVIRDLRRINLIREEDKVVHSHARLLKYANIIFDLQRADALKLVHGYLDDVGIAYCGRYGDWGYMWTDESFKSGELAAEKVLASVKSGQKAARGEKLNAV